MTFSIVARDDSSGAFGVATATGGPVVGSLVPHARAKVGAIATQSSTNPNYGYLGLDLLEQGNDAKTVIDMLTDPDEGRERRQCLIIGKKGEPGVWTGSEVLSEIACHKDDHVAAAGNMLDNVKIAEAMVGAYLDMVGEPLEERLLAALQAGETEGGDRRGIKSAALKVYTTERFPNVDLRADWSETPIEDLRAILNATRQTSYADFFKGLPTRDMEID